MFKKFLVALAASSFLVNSAQAASIEDAVRFAVDVANDQSHGYSQGSPPYSDSRDGPDYDCSSLIYYALNHAGFNIIENWQRNPAYMSRYNGRQLVGDADTIWSDLNRDEWIKLSWQEAKDNLVRGDILANAYHCAFYLRDDLTVEARGVNNPTGRGRYDVGDQGGEIDFYHAQGRGWSEVYRYVGN